jgi:hypothetical protein
VLFEWLSNTLWHGKLCQPLSSNRPRRLTILSWQFDISAYIKCKSVINGTYSIHFTYSKIGKRYIPPTRVDSCSNSIFNSKAVSTGLGGTGVALVFIINNGITINLAHMDYSPHCLFVR